MREFVRRRRWRVPARLAPVVFAFYMSTIMGFLMCLVITATARGIGPGYLASFVKAYMLAVPVAFICVLLVRPLVLRLVALTIETPESGHEPANKQD